MAPKNFTVTLYSSSYEERSSYEKSSPNLQEMMKAMNKMFNLKMKIDKSHKYCCFTWNQSKQPEGYWFLQLQTTYPDELFLSWATKDKSFVGCMYPTDAAEYESVIIEKAAITPEEYDEQYDYLYEKHPSLVSEW